RVSGPSLASPRRTTDTRAIAMTEKRLLWCLGGVTALALVVALVVYVVRGLEDRVTPGNCARIREGMAVKEVEAILGRPADLVEGGVFMLWAGERWMIIVDLDARRAVIGKSCAAAEPGIEKLKPTVWQKLRGLLPW